MDKKIPTDALDLMGNQSKKNLLAIGQLLIGHLNPDDFLDIEVKEVVLALPKRLIENKVLLEVLLISTTSIYKSLIENYLYSLEKEGATITAMADESIKEILEVMFEIISCKASLNKDMKIGDFIMPIKETIQ